MSLRTELQEVVKWMADLADEKAKPTPERPTYEDWVKVQNNLDDAAQTLGQARNELTNEGAPVFLAELAADLERQAEELSVRAGLLKRRAEPETEAQRKAKEEAKERAKAEDAARAAARAKAKADAAAEAAARKQAAEGTAKGEAGKTGTAEAEESLAATGLPTTTPGTTDSADVEPPASVRRLKTALHTLDTAHLNLEVEGQPNPIAAAFLAEIEVLFEMTLSLRQRVEQYAQVAQAEAGKTDA